MPFGVSWPTYLKYWASGIAGAMCGSQVVHNFFKPLEGLEESIEKEYQALREKFPPPTIEERVARFDEMHKKLEEYEQNKKPWKLPEWLTWKK